MTIQEKLGIIYARIDCGRRSCDNCAAKPICSDTNLIDLIQETQKEVRTLIKERDELKEAQTK